MTVKMKIDLPLLVVVLAIAGPGCARQHDVYVRDPGEAPMADGRNPTNAAPVPGEIVVAEAPPPPQVEVVGNAPGSNYQWIPGYWEWREHYVWVPGHWAVAPNPHARWVPGHWTRHARGWVWIRGYWR